MSYRLFLMDLDDTLLDFRASEKLSFLKVLQEFNIKNDFEELYALYQIENRKQWQMFEQGQTTKDLLKVARFQKLFESAKIEADYLKISERYLENLPESVVLVDGAVEVCQWIRTHAELGIITNGIQDTQTRRIANSPLKDLINFVVVSEEAGFAKPDLRFFEYSVKNLPHFQKNQTLIVGDRLETDIAGAQLFGVDACWFNPQHEPIPAENPPRYVIQKLMELPVALASQLANC